MAQLDPASQKPTQEELFRASLEDVRDIARKLFPHCKTTPELIEQVEGALESEAHFKLLMSTVLGGKR